MAGIAVVSPDGPGGSRDPNLPPIDLPSFPGAPEGLEPGEGYRVDPATGRRVLRVNLRPERVAQAEGAFGATMPDYVPAAPSGRQARPGPAEARSPNTAAPQEGGFGATLPDYDPQAEQAARHAHEMGGLEAMSRGIRSGMTFGGDPALQGVAAAGRKTIGGLPGREGDEFPLSGAIDVGTGLWQLFKENVIDPARGINPAGITGLVTGDRSGPATKAYRQQRDKEYDALQEAREQYPKTTFGGEVLGALAVPLPGGAGLARPGTFLQRLGRGAKAGAAAGALFGAGSALSRGAEPWNAEGLADIGKSAAITGTVGAPIQALLHGALGPRLPLSPTTPGGLAAQTAENLGAPIPRGLASDNRAINATTAKVRSVPLIGSRISSAVDATQAAAGRRIGEIARGSRGAPPDRALAGSVLRPALEQVIADNNARIDQAYHVLRHVADTNRFGAVANTRTAFEAIMRARRGARMAKPESGLTDVAELVGQGRKPGGGVSFNQLQRARNHLAQTIEWARANPNPGFDVADLRRIYAAMTTDMEAIIRQHARIAPDRAVDVLRQAHQVAQIMIGQNSAAQRVLNLRADENLVGSLVNAAQERTGNLRLLADLRASMHPDDFHHIAGALLAEMGRGPGGEFSLNRFINNWANISEGARGILFTPQHLRNIEDIVGMGQHIRGALRESNTSHTAGVLIMFDLARDAILLSASAAAGTMTGATMVGGALGAPSVLLAHWLSRPAVASSMARWNHARTAWLLGKTAGKLAVYMIATRNLAHTLGVPAALITHHAEQQEQGQSTNDERPLETER
jgi:hypothetical protein